MDDTIGTEFERVVGFGSSGIEREPTGRILEGSPAPAVLECLIARVDHRSRHASCL
jgi:hypothetical protein